MAKKRYQSPVILEISSDGNGSVTGQGTGQGTFVDGDGGDNPVISFEEWFEEIAMGGANPDADYDLDGDVDEDDYNYYISHSDLWQ